MHLNRDGIAIYPIGWRSCDIYIKHETQGTQGHYEKRAESGAHPIRTNPVMATVNRKQAGILRQKYK